MIRYAFLLTIIDFFASTIVLLFSKENITAVLMVNSFVRPPVILIACASVIFLLNKLGVKSNILRIVLQFPINYMIIFNVLFFLKANPDGYVKTFLVLHSDFKLYSFFFLPFVISTIVVLFYSSFVKIKKNN